METVRDRICTIPPLELRSILVATLFSLSKITSEAPFAEKQLLLQTFPFFVQHHLDKLP